MKKLTKALVTGSAALLLVLSLGAGFNNAHASIHADNYGVDVFPNKKTHNRFAYQLRKRGHHGRIYFASANGRLGRAIFHNGGVPNDDYANFMARHEHRLYKAINKKLDGRISRRHINRYNHKDRIIRRGLKHRARKQSVYKAHFKRSNSRRALRRSGFYNAYPDGGHFIFDKYAPNNKRAIVSKKANTSEWFQGTFGEDGRYISVYDYSAPQHGWILVHKAQTLPRDVK